MHSPSRPARLFVTRLRSLAPIVAGAGLALGAVVASTVATAPVIDARPSEPAVTLAASSNPLAGRHWGVYQGPGDQAWQPWVNATGTTKTTLAKIALRPKAKWFGAWIPNDKIADSVRKYVENSQAGDPSALVQMAVFRMVPWEHDACNRLPTAAEQASYKTWINRFASAVGNAHAAIILQPDGPFALCAPHGSTLPSQLIAYSAKVFGALPNSSVYIDAGAADWPSPGKQGGVDSAVKIAVRAGVKYVRGVALNSTHYSATGLEVARGAAIVRALAAKGITGKHVVINTSSNGHPFEFGKYTGSDADNAYVCPSRTVTMSATCVTLGIPPTTDVANTKWHLSATNRSLALRYVDAYMWFGRPWLYRQSDPFVMDRALHLVRSSPF